MDFFCHFPRAGWALWSISPWWRGGNAALCSSCLIRQRINLTSLPPLPYLSPGLDFCQHPPTLVQNQLWHWNLRAEFWFSHFWPAPSAKMGSVGIVCDGQSTPAVFAETTVQDPAAGTVTLSWIPSPARFVCPVFQAAGALQGCSVPCHTEGCIQHTPPGTKEMTPSLVQFNPNSSYKMS